MERVEGGPRFTITTAAGARATIANAFLKTDSAPEMGTIELQPHQLEACARLREAIAVFGGALLCDPVGTGKTFTALAVARGYSDVVVVAPAVLRTMWNAAAESSGVNVAFVSYESLSRSGSSASPTGLVILDEAHHARNPGTKRFAALTALAKSSDVLLLSATPIHNRRNDLIALLSIFLGERASGLSSAELGVIVVRRDRAAERSRLATPSVAAIRWNAVSADDRIPNAILSLPPPLPVRDGGDGGVLIAHSLLRQWASSDAALRAGLDRRRLKAAAMRASLESGIWPTAGELASWTMAEGSIQLAFANLIGTADGDVSHLIDAVELHDREVRALLDLLPRQSERDAATAEVIRGLRVSHRGIRTVAFSQYEETVRAMFAHLARDGLVAALTGHGGRVAGGRITRDQAIARFAPEASGVSRADRANDVTLLLTTDLLSEGVNLQDAGMVIHLDLPWTPARMEQRLGRVARFGSRHETVHACAFRPPARAETLARIEQILEFKSNEASGIRNEPLLIEALTTRLRSWQAGSARNTRCCVAASVRARGPGFLAACRLEDRVALLGSTGRGESDDPATLVDCAVLAEGPDATSFSSEIDDALQAIMSHFALACALDGISHSSGTSPVRRRMFASLSRAVETSRTHERHHVASIARLARAEIRGRMGRYREAELARALSTDNKSLDALATLQEPARITSGQSGERGQVDVLALIIFVDETRGMACQSLP